MNSPAIRELVKKAYPGNKWSSDVDQMNDKQLFAVFMRLRKSGRITL